MSKNKIEIVIKAPASKVWKAIIEKEQISQWLMPVDDFAPELGNISHMRWGDGEEIVNHTYIIKEIVPEKKLVLLWRVSGFPGDTIITYELNEEDRKTKLTFTLQGWEGAAFESNKQSRDEDLEGWRSVIEKVLKDHIEK